MWGGNRGWLGDERGCALLATPSPIRTARRLTMPQRPAMKSSTRPERPRTPPTNRTSTA